MTVLAKNPNPFAGPDAAVPELVGGGRPRGVKNKRTLEQIEFGNRILDAEWEKKFKERVDAGLVSDTLMALVMHYKYGKPMQRIEVTGEDGDPLVQIQVVVVDAKNSND